MKRIGMNLRGCSSNEIAAWPFVILLVLLLSHAALQPVAGAQQQKSITAQSSPLTAEQVVERLAGMNLRRAQALHSYRGTRTYLVEYRGFPRTAGAEMVVDVTYHAPGTKEFTIRSTTGSELIIDKVFKKLLRAEQDAMSADVQRHTALSCENYDFTMLGYEDTSLRKMYVLAAEPKTRSKFLFRGRIWVDANDFAVVRLVAEPAKSPSFWTKSSEIEQFYVKVSDFWLPERNHSISSIRLGGRAELTIEYQNYLITASGPISSMPAEEIARSAD